jgi:hypothetical protein
VSQSSTRLSSGEKATDQSQPEWPSSVCRDAPVSVSQSRAVSSRDTDATRLPFAEKATEVTTSEWPSSVCRAAPVFTSQRRIILSCDPDTTSLPSGEKATELTMPEWPSSVCRAAPVFVSHSRTVSSHDPDATSLPSGEKATEFTSYEWPSITCREELQSSCTFGILWIQAGIHPSNRLRIMLFSGAKTRAEQYIWRGVSSTTDRLNRANRFASCINAYRAGLSVA